MSRRLTLFAAAGTLAFTFMAYVRAQPPGVQSPGRPGAGFQGYWMGVDPVDGGDARRSIVQLDNGKFALAARDSVLSLCDSTDRGLGTFDDGELVSRNVMQSNNLTLRCFNNGASVTLHVTFELIGNGLMVEVAALANGNPVSTILFHKVSQG